MSTITFEVPRAWWWSSNTRLHWAQRAQRTRWVRQMAAHAARTTPTYQRAHLHAYVAYPRANRADPSNIVGTVLKAAIDGIVDAGVLPDDDSAHLPSVTIERDPPTGRTGVYRLRLVLTRPGKDTQ